MMMPENADLETKMHILLHNDQLHSAIRVLCVELVELQDEMRGLKKQIEVKDGKTT